MEKLKIGDSIKTTSGDYGVVTGFLGDAIEASVSKTESTYLYEDEFTNAELVDLNENQQIVLEIMKNIQKKWPHFHPSSVIDTLMELESEYYDELTKIEELQLFQVFITWAIEQENLVHLRREL